MISRNTGRAIGRIFPKTTAGALRYQSAPAVAFVSPDHQECFQHASYDQAIIYSASIVFSDSDSDDSGLRTGSSGRTWILFSVLASR